MQTGNAHMGLPLRANIIRIGSPNCQEHATRITGEHMALNHKKTVSYRLAQAAKALRNRSGTHLNRLGIHPGQEGLLKALEPCESMAMGELAKILSVQPPTVTKMIARLSAQGLVQRVTSRHDGRQAFVSLTEEGRSRLKKVDKSWKRLEKEVLADIDEEDIRKLRKVLKQIERNLTSGSEKS